MSPGVLIKGRTVSYYFLSVRRLLEHKIIVVHAKLWGKLCFIAEKIFALSSYIMWYVFLKLVAKYC